MGGGIISLSLFADRNLYFSMYTGSVFFDPGTALKKMENDSGMPDEKAAAKDG